MGLKEEIEKVPFWYHRIDLGGGIETPGYMPHCQELYQLPERLDGKRVLDVGAWDGYWTFEALKRGAKEVVAIDDWSDYPLVANERPQEWATFDLCKKALGYTDEQCNRYTLSAYDCQTLGEFDIIFFFGALYHCRHPLLVLEKLSSVCRSEIYIETAICDDYSPYHVNIGGGHGGGIAPVMEFYPTTELGGIQSNWWSPNTTCLYHMLKVAGWNKVDVWKIEKPENAALCRGFAKGIK